MNEDFVNFNSLQDKQYIRLYHRDVNIGYFQIVQIYNSNPNAVGINTILVQKLKNDATNDDASLFTINLEDRDYKFENIFIKHGAGIVFYYGGKILLVHTKGGEKQKSYTYPKGEANEGEDYAKTAIREVREEIGVDFPIELLDQKRFYQLQYFKGVDLKIRHFYIVELTKEQYKRYFNTNIIPKENLELSEIDWAGFVPIEKCKDLLKTNYELILNYF